ncbi:hypothetical protein PMAYCL1PPCAC_22823, partial [Pristionchus mayeri]
FILHSFSLAMLLCRGRFLVLLLLSLSSGEGEKTASNAPPESNVASIETTAKPAAPTTSAAAAVPTPEPKTASPTEQLLNVNGTMSEPAEVPEEESSIDNSTVRPSPTEASTLYSSTTEQKDGVED